VGRILRHAALVGTARFSADGSLIVTGSDDRTARVWDTETGQPVGEPLHHDSGVFGADFSRDGSRIVTASGDTARVWDIAVDLDSPLPAWVQELAEALAGRRFNEQGVLVRSEKSLVELRKELLTLRGSDFWSRLGRWFFMSGPERTISPDA